MTDEINVDAIAELLVEARHLLVRIADDLAPIVGKPDRVPTKAVADLLALADEAQHLAAVVIYPCLRHVAQIKAEGNRITMTPFELEVDRVARALATAIDQLASVTSVVGTAYRWPGTVESGALADVLDLADQLRVAAIDVCGRLAHVALIRCEANSETRSIVSPTGLVGWVAEGGGRAAYVRRMSGSELEAAR